MTRWALNEDPECFKSLSFRIWYWKCIKEIFKMEVECFTCKTRVLAIEQHWLCAQFFLIIKNVILKHFRIKRFLVSLDRKDALNSICQTLAFLLDMSLKHCLFFMDNLWQFEFKWPENLTEGYSPNFPGLSTKALLPAFP